MAADVAEVVGYSEDAASPLTVLKPASFASGEMLIFLLGQDGGVVTSLTKPADWTDITSVTGGGVPAKAWYHVFTGGDPASWDFGYDAGSDVAGQLLRITGADATTPTITFASTAAGPNSGAMTGPSVTPTGSDDLAIGAIFVFGAGNALSETDPAGWTDRGQAQLLTFQAIASVSKQLSSGSATGTLAWSSITPATANGASMTLAIKSAGGGGAATDASPPARGIIPPPILFAAAAQRAGLFVPSRVAATITGTAVATFSGPAATIVATPTVLGVAAAALGRPTGTIIATPTVTGTANAALGRATGTVTGTPTVLATAAAPLGRLTGTATVGAAAVTGTANAALGRATGTAIALPTVPGVAVAAAGALTATAIGKVTHSGTLAAPLGRATGTALGRRSTTGTASAPLGRMAAGTSGQAPSTGLAGNAHGPLPLAAGAITVHTVSIAGAVT